MRKYVSGSILIFLFPLLLAAQTNRFRVMEYNVENLFDCVDDSLKSDEEFLPNSLRRWHYGRYRDKLARISKVIVAVGGEQVPDLVALCEVENERVIKDLTRYSPLKVLGYRYVVTNSPDERGIDVALLYQPGRFRHLSHRSIRIPQEKGYRPTRDLLHVSGLVQTGDTLDLFVCHFPSRRSHASNRFRLQVASVLKLEADSLLNCRERPFVIILGDFNDEPDSPALHEVLVAGMPKGDIISRCLYNLSGYCKPGTYRYQGEWDTLDQFIVSGTFLISDSTLSIPSFHAEIGDFPFLLEEDIKFGGYKPFRTYIGPRYRGGYSDHLPVWVDVFLSNVKGN